MQIDFIDINPQTWSPEPLTFDKVRQKGTERSTAWHQNGEQWSSADWGNAMQGEVGEMVEALLITLETVASAGKVSNLVKKLRRVETGIRGSKDAPSDQLKKDLSDEMADILLYLDLLAAHFDIDLGESVRSKFNEVSEREGFDHRL